MHAPVLPSLAAAAALATGLALVACGARGPLDTTIVVEGAPSEAGADAATVDALPDRAPDVNTAPFSGFDAGPLFSCGTCVTQTCGTELVTCAGSPTCLTALECVATMCLSGGAPDLTCAATCAGGDPSTIGSLVSAFMCVLESCGSSCVSLLGAIPGGNGGGAG